MNNRADHFSDEQRKVAVQRLTALWAFAESGLGGMLHLFKVPFTGLIVGGMAVLLITLIAFFSQQHLRTIFHSLLIVLIIKAVVSPYTPFTAYAAVSFQALIAYSLFSLFKINIISILLLAVIAMVESAMQKVFVLTLFFGESFWKATDGMTNLIAKELGITISNGSMWIVSIYLLIHVIGGIIIAWVAYKMTKEIFLKKNTLAPDFFFTNEIPLQYKKRKNKKIWAFVIVLVILSLLLFLFADDTKKGWLAVLKTLSWTSAAILLWYLLVSPLLTKIIQTFLRKKGSRYSEEVANTLSFLPELKQLSAVAWQKSRRYSGLRRLRYFSSIMVNWSLTCPQPNNPE